MRSLPYALTIFLGAFLLFTIQLVIAKAIVPWFGGTPSVWTTCLVFFQALLTLGYAYAHGSIRFLRPRAQGALHAVLVLGACGALVTCARAWGSPLLPGDLWKPTDGDHPVADILTLLCAATAVPYLVLSSTSPLVQAWFARAFPQRSAVRLYALSNAGSLLALLSYPFLIEPRVGLRWQAQGWAILFAAFALGSLACAAGARTDAPDRETASDAVAPDWRRCLWWFVLSACGSMLLMATSNQISQEISTSPVLWSLPLATYLLTFIVCFDRERTYNRTVFSWLFGAGMLATVWELQEASLHDPRLVLAAALATLFIGCMICHGELVRSKPDSGHLTLFYLTMSVGGAVGGSFVSLGAPLLFGGFWEMQVSQLLTALLLVIALMRDRESWLHGSARALIFVGAVTAGVALLGAQGLMMRREPWVAVANSAVGVTLATAALLGGLVATSMRQQLGLQRGRGQRMLAGVALAVSVFGAALAVTARPFAWTDVICARRNFYGMLRVLDFKTSYVLVHGSTYHGWQLHEAPRLTTGYYGPGGGVATVIDAMKATRPKLDIGVLGLGAGQMAAFLRPADALVYYEIDPNIIDVAAGPDALFSFVRNSLGKVSVVRGDGRLSLERESRTFDLLVMDAFSSDSIPVHLLTREAFDTYMKRLKPDGVLLVHISNRYLDLVPLVKRQCADQGLTTAFVFRAIDGAFTVSNDARDKFRISTLWAIAPRDGSFLRIPKVAQAITPQTDAPPLDVPWTDDWSNVWQMLRK